MKRVFIFLTILAFFAISVYAQTPDSLMHQAKLSYQSFEFESAIHLSQTALPLTQNKATYLDFLSLIGISYYNLWKDDSSKVYFTKIFEADSTYRLDSSNVSPKIVSFFNEQLNLYQLKKKSASIVFRKPAEVLPGTEIQSTLAALQEPQINKMAFLHSTLFPGLGQFTQGSNTKGWAFVSAGFVSLASSIYFIIDTNVKAKKYHSANAQSEIDKAYSEYNTAYQLRNVSVSIYLGTWVVNLYDIFFN
jgi:hypothetical protein